MKDVQRYTGPDRRVTQRRNGRDRRGVFLSEPSLSDRRRIPTRRSFSEFSIPAND